MTGQRLIGMTSPTTDGHSSGQTETPELARAAFRGDPRRKDSQRHRSGCNRKDDLGRERQGVNYQIGLAGIAALAQPRPVIADGQHRSAALRQTGRTPPKASRYAMAALAGAQLLAACFVLSIVNLPQQGSNASRLEELAGRVTASKHLIQALLTHLDPGVRGSANKFIKLGGLLELAAQSDRQAQFVVGLLYATGQGGAENNYEQSLNWWKQAAESGSAEAAEALTLAAVFRDDGPLPQKWVDLVAFVTRDKDSFEKLSPKEIASKITAMANIKVESTTADARDTETPDLSAQRAWISLRDSSDVGALKRFANRFRENIYGELALDRTTNLLRYTDSFHLDSDGACKVASSYSLSDTYRKTVRIWSLPTGRLKHIFSVPDRINRTALLGGYIAIPTDHQVTLFDVQSGSIKHSIAFEQSGDLIASQDAKQLLLLGGSTGALVSVVTGRGVNNKGVFRMEIRDRIGTILNVDTGETEPVSLEKLRFFIE